MRSSAQKAETGTSPIPDSIKISPEYDFEFSSKTKYKEAMKIKIILHAMLRKKQRDLMDQSPVTIKANSVGELFDELKLGSAEALIVFVNGKRAGVESVIEDGDEIKIFPLLGGG
jgi:sulfur carrier protein ThiS